MWTAMDDVVMWIEWIGVWVGKLLIGLRSWNEKRIEDMRLDREQDLKRMKHFEESWEKTRWKMGESVCRDERRFSMSRERFAC